MSGMSSALVRVKGRVAAVVVAAVPPLLLFRPRKGGGGDGWAPPVDMVLSSDMDLGLLANLNADTREERASSYDGGGTRG